MDLVSTLKMLLSENASQERILEAASTYVRDQEQALKASALTNHNAESRISTLVVSVRSLTGLVATLVPHCPTDLVAKADELLMVVELDNIRYEPIMG